MGLSLELSFNFYQGKLTEGLKYEKDIDMSLTSYHDTLAWYNEQLFGDEGRDENSQLENGDEDGSEDGDEEGPNAAFHRKWLQQWKD